MIDGNCGGGKVTILDCPFEEHKWCLVKFKELSKVLPLFYVWLNSSKIVVTKPPQS